MANVELFDTHNRINFPTDAQVASMSPAAQERFKGVAAAKAKLDAATAHRESVAKRIKECEAELVSTKEQMNKLAPKWTETQNIKAHIASEQAQRRRERGLE